MVPDEISSESLSSSKGHFAVPISSPVRVQVAAARGVVPKKTSSNMQWTVNNFNSWANERSKRGPSYCVPPDLLKSHDAELVAKWLCLFVMETHREDKKPYPPSTISNLVSGLNRVLQSNKAPFSILSKGDIRFHEFFNTLDTLMSSLYRDGIGVCKDSAIAISPEHEELFWRKNV